MPSVLIELHFLPSLEYFCALLPFNKIILERHEHFNKQSYRNRCHVLTAHKVARLSIPLMAKHAKVKIAEVQIDYTTRWQSNFWRTLESAYAKAPYFKHYADDLKKEIFRRQTHLYDMNLQLLSMCLQWLHWDKAVSESVAYEKIPPPGITDLRGLISAKKDFSGRDFYQPQPYRQVFGNNFAPNLSLIDLVFCEGPNAAALLRASQRKK